MLAKGGRTAEPAPCVDEVSNTDVQRSGEARQLPLPSCHSTTVGILECSSPYTIAVVARVSCQGQNCRIAGKTPHRPFCSVE